MKFGIVIEFLEVCKEFFLEMRKKKKEIKFVVELCSYFCKI